MPVLKKRKEGDPFPDNFWNYSLNPILGYEYKPQKRNYKNEEMSYWKKPQPLK